jgi:hypothetical protein
MLQKITRASAGQISGWHGSWFGRPSAPNTINDARDTRIIGRKRPVSGPETAFCAAPTAYAAKNTTSRNAAKAGLAQPTDGPNLGADHAGGRSRNTIQRPRAAAERTEIGASRSGDHAADGQKASVR